MNPRARRKGIWVTGAVTAAILAMTTAILAAGSFNEQSFHVALRATARTSVVLFVLAFAASSLRRLIPSRPTEWLLANRRYIGLSFAGSHLLHLGAILAIALFWPTRSVRARGFADLLPGVTVYVLIVALAVTSFDGAVATIGPRRWRLLHTVGGYAIWLAFIAPYMSRALHNVAYAPILLILTASLGLRVYVGLRAEGPP
jgi:hypothetical protein